MGLKKRVVVAHGIGVHAAGFEKLWEPELKAAAQPTGVDIGEVQGMYWDDVQQQLADHYPVVSQNLNAALAELGLPAVPTNSSAYQMLEDYVLDVVFYLMHEMGTVLLANCADRLEDACDGEEGHTILIGHSLGAAMLPHAVWWRHGTTHDIPYLSLILLASPLGILSPLPAVVQDPLEIMRRLTPAISIPYRPTMLRRFASAWCGLGDGRLNFISNQNDLVCADVVYDDLPDWPPLLAGHQLLPQIRKGFDAAERNAITGQLQNVIPIQAGTPTVGGILDNHDVHLYLRSPEFIQTFQRLLRE